MLQVVKGMHKFSISKGYNGYHLFLRLNWSKKSPPDRKAAKIQHTKVLGKGAMKRMNYTYRSNGYFTQNIEWKDVSDDEKNNYHSAVKILKSQMNVMPESLKSSGSSVEKQFLLEASTCNIHILNQSFVFEINRLQRKLENSLSGQKAKMLKNHSVIYNMPGRIYKNSRCVVESYMSYFTFHSFILELFQSDILYQTQNSYYIATLDMIKISKLFNGNLEADIGSKGTSLVTMRVELKENPRQVSYLKSLSKTSAEIMKRGSPVHLSEKVSLDNCQISPFLLKYSKASGVVTVLFQRVVYYEGGNINTTLSS